jgi:hypothetical protein
LKIDSQKRPFLLAAGIIAAAVLLVLGAFALWKYVLHPDPPKIAVAPAEYSFGKLAEGVQVKHEFQVSNKGGSVLIIKEAKPTCDCTTVKLGGSDVTKNAVPAGKGEVAAGKSTNMEVTIDTTMKMGEVKKEILIKTNDPVHPETKVSLTAIVDPHEGMSSTGPSKLFSAKCGVCHVTPGIGKEGEDLYLADCAMCHGFRADGAGAPAPSLVSTNLEDKAARDRLREITAFGSKKHQTAMPGFIKEAGGPLSAKQVDSLVEYLRWRRSIR